MTYQVGIRMKTTSPVTELEDILEMRCQGDWKLELDTVNSEMHQKTLAIYFETQRDCDAFIAGCSL